jgi:glycosyltransferase involved in cell wall biosynthesis
MKPHRVLLLVDCLGQGGAARVVINTALALDRSCFSPVVCTTRQAAANGQDDILRDAGVPLVELDRNSRWDPRPWRSLWQLLPTVSILHSHESGSNFWGRLWGRLFRVPIIVTQDHTAANEKSRTVHMVDRLMSSLSDRIVTVSRFDRQLSIQYEKLPARKVVTIYNGIDVEEFSHELDQMDARRRAGLPEQGWLLAIIARLAEQKNHRGLLEALALLPPDIAAKTRCLVIGSGPLHDQLQSEVQQRGLDRMVSFLGQRKDVPVIMKAIDMLVLPSHWECLPVVALEALAAGCPIVSTAVGGVPEVLDGVGWPLVAPGDPVALSNAIGGVLRMPEPERQRMARAGRKIVQERFSMATSVAQVEMLYHALLKA